MRIKHHYYKYAKRRLLEFLDSNKIAYILDCGQDKNSAMCSFDLYEDSVAFSRFRWLFPVFMGYWSFASVEYSDEEIEAAEWLLIRSISKKVSWEFEEGISLYMSLQEYFHKRHGVSPYEPSWVIDY